MPKNIQAYLLSWMNEEARGNGIYSGMVLQMNKKKNVNGLCLQLLILHAS